MARLAHVLCCGVYRLHDQHRWCLSVCPVTASFGVFLTRQLRTDDAHAFARPAAAPQGRVACDSGRAVSPARTLAIVAEVIGVCV